MNGHSRLTMALDIVYRPEAIVDIHNIAAYTIERWGRQQAQNYMATLRKDIESLTEFALRYPIHEASALNLRRMNSGHHLLFYLVTDQTVEIIRILHERMDLDDAI